MELTLHMPNDVAQRSPPQGAISPAAPEAFALEEFKAGWLIEPQLRQLLGLQTRHELDGFLKAHEVWLDYTLGDLERDRETHRQLGL